MVSGKRGSSGGSGRAGGGFFGSTASMKIDARVIAVRIVQRLEGSGPLHLDFADVGLRLSSGASWVKRTVRVMTKLRPSSAVPGPVAIDRSTAGSTASDSADRLSTKK